METLGHKNIKNTLVYVHLAEALFKDQIEYVSNAYWVWGDNFNDNSLAQPPWTILVNGVYSVVREQDQCLEQYVSSELPNWRSAALRRDNDIEFTAGSWVWVDIIPPWGEGTWNEKGITLWVGARLAELVISNEQYGAGLVRYGIKREVYAANGAWGKEYHSRTMATRQYGDNTAILEPTLFDVPGPEQGYVIALGLHHVGGGVEFWFWTSYPGGDGTLYHMCTFWDWAFTSDYIYPIFGIYSCYQESQWWFGWVNFDDFNIYHD